MNAIILDDKLNLTWEKVPNPVRKDNKILIKVAAAAVNCADLLQKDECCASPPDWPPGCGLECSGVVEEAPENSRFKVGDDVCALLGGGYSQYVTVPEGMVMPAPEKMDIVLASGLSEVGATAYLNINIKAGGLIENDIFLFRQEQAESTLLLSSWQNLPE